MRMITNRLVGAILLTHIVVSAGAMNTTNLPMPANNNCSGKNRVHASLIL